MDARNGRTLPHGAARGTGRGQRNGATYESGTGWRDDAEMGRRVGEQECGSARHRNGEVRGGEETSTIVRKKKNRSEVAIGLKEET